VAPDAELRASLREGALSPATLVWSEGMTDWLPAANVAELWEMPNEPDLNDEMPTLMRRNPLSFIAEQMAPKIVMPGGAPAPMMGGPLPGGPAPQETAGSTLLGVPPPSAGSAPMPLDMPRAQKAPVRGKGATMVLQAVAAPAPQHLAPPVASGPGPAPSGPPNRNIPTAVGYPTPLVGGGNPLNQGPPSGPMPMAAPLGEPPAPAAPPGFSGDPNPFPFADQPPPGPPPGFEPPMGLPPGHDAGGAPGGLSTPVKVALGAGAVVLLSLIGVGIAMIIHLKSAPPPASSASAPTSASAAPAEPPRPRLGAELACKVDRAGQKVLGRASRAVPIEVLLAGGKATLGFSMDGRSPTGLEVDLGSMKTRTLKTPRAAGKLRRVYPFSADGSTAFVVDDEPAKRKLQEGAGLADPKPYYVGLDGGALARAERLSGDTQKLWPTPVGAAEIRVLPVPGDGAFVGARSADALFVGRLGADRAPKGDLVQLSSGDALGAWALGLAADEAAVIAQLRGAAGLKVAHGPKAGALAKAEPLALAAVGADAGSFSLAGVDGGRWLLVWTEGKEGARQLRALTLSSLFDPVGEPLTIAAPEANVGPAGLAVAGKQGAVFYAAAAKKGVELWGATISCP
jgi:hypothetical protein